VVFLSGRRARQGAVEVAGAAGEVDVGASVAVAAEARLLSPTTSGLVMNVGFSQLAPTSG
jgi:hypothetical protein